MVIERKQLRIGFIGLDTSHVEVFARLLMDSAHEHHVPGGIVVIAMPGGSPDFELSRTRVSDYTTKLHELYGVQIVDTPEAVAKACDVIFIESVDGRVHREQFERAISYGKPTFIDKPFATTLEDAEAMVSLAEKHNVPLMSCSSLRYAVNFQAALANEGLGAIRGIDTSGPLRFQDTQPGYLWYGIHCFEMIVAALGTGCVSVQTKVFGEHEIVLAEWADGRVATYHGLRNAHSQFVAVLHRDQGASRINASDPSRSSYASLLDVIINTLAQGRSDVPAPEMLEVIRIIEAANRSRESGKLELLTRTTKT